MKDVITLLRNVAAEQEMDLISISNYVEGGISDEQRTESFGKWKKRITKEKQNFIKHLREAIVILEEK